MRKARWIYVVPGIILVLVVATGCGKKYVYEPPTGGPLSPEGGSAYASGAEGEFETRSLDGEEVNLIPDFSSLETAESGFLGPNERVPEGPKMRVPELQTVYFDYDTSSLRNDQENILRKNAEYLLGNPAVRVEVQGHCDERGTDDYNMALGDRRALTVRAYLTASGIEPERIYTISYGEAAPAVEGQSNDAFAQNRRAEFWVIHEGEGL